MIRLAEYQIRLLLCRPSARLRGRLCWKCGCVAERCEPHLFCVETCPLHSQLLAVVRHEERNLYEWPEAAI